MPVVAPADRRFLRAAVRPARRRRSWRRWLLLFAKGALAIGLGLYAGARGAHFARASSLFEVRTVVVSGTHRLTEHEVLSMVEDLKGLNIFGVDLEEWRLRLLALPWIASAETRRQVPSTVVVRITERHPVGIARVGERLLLVDAEGTFVDDYGPRYADLDLPIIEGLPPGTHADRARMLLAAGVLAALESRPDLMQRVSQVDVSNPRDAVVSLDGDAVLLRLGDRDFAERLASYLDLAPSLREHVSDIRYVDLRFGRQVYVGGMGRRMPAGTSLR